MTETPLPFTGERFMPECPREMRYEHWHRYAFALPLARGRRVLDAACGEGYGSALLAREAAEVVGVDISTDTVAHARRRYGENPRLRFAAADCTQLAGWDAAAFDIIVSFETLEHVIEQERMLDGFARLLTDSGVLLISSPDKRTYSDLRNYHNEFHVCELYRGQLEALLRARFPAFRLYGQKLLFQSALWNMDCDKRDYSAATLTASGDSINERLDYAPLYYVAVCAKQPEILAKLPALSLFGDAEESVYTHYDGEVRRNIAAGYRILELESALEKAQQRSFELERQLALKP